MSIINKYKSFSLEEAFTKYFSHQNETISLEPLIFIFEVVKIKGMDSFLNFLMHHENEKKHFIYYLNNIFSNKKFSNIFTEADIFSETSFFSEFKKRIVAKILPEVEDENSISYIISKVLMNSKKNFNFLKKIDENQLDELLKILSFDKIINSKNVKQELLSSINILSWRMIGNALDVEVLKMVPEYENFDNPFLALQNELKQLTIEYQNDISLDFNSKDVHYKQIKIYLRQCLEFINQAFKNTTKYGISNKTNQALMQIRQQILRVSEIINLLVIDNSEDLLIKSKNLICDILEYKSHRINLRELLSESTLQISHLITSHTAQTGSHYISFNFKEYMGMFWKSAGGGVIVGMLCILKMFYSYHKGSEFTHALLYSFNYAMGFIMIYLLHYTLATKQPAMTAATMAKVLSEENNNTSKNYIEFADLVSKLFRTQFIAFIGNVLLAFPVALLLIYGLDFIFHQNFASAKSDKLLYDLDPIHSKAILHACIAGFFLFISGIIAGNVENNSRYYKMPQRISKNPYLIRAFGKTTAKNLANFYSKNWSGIISNFWFGVFLGVIAPIGIFFGLDLDIRHITFSAGNFALALYGKGFEIDAYTFWISFITIFIIGFFNFIVSFGLSIILAIRSRKVNFGEFGLIMKEIFKLFIKNPFKFFLPVKSKFDENTKQMMEDGVSNEEEKTPIKKVNL